MRTELDIVIKNSEELESYVDENQDLVFPDNDIRIEFMPRENEIRDIECKNLFMCKFGGGIVSERFDFYGRDIICWGDCIMRDFFGRVFDGGNFVGRDWEGRNGIMWNFEGRNIIYYAVFISYHSFLCSSVFGQVENSIHKCLNDEIEYRDEKDFEYGTYSVY
ncbi:MAG: hypothetical protein ABII97_03280 [Patescibacteria group bacterium]